MLYDLIKRPICGLRPIGCVGNRSERDRVARTDRTDLAALGGRAMVALVAFDWLERFSVWHDRIVTCRIGFAY